MGEKTGWENSGIIFQDLYVNNTVNGGRPNIVPINILIKVLFIHSIYHLVDEQVQRELHDRISLMHSFDSRTPYHVP